MTNEEKLKRIEELEHQILLNQKEITDIKDSIRYETDYTGRYYQNRYHDNRFAKVIDEKSDGCLVLEFELHENLYDEDVIPKNNEFSLTVYLSWKSKYNLESHWVQVDKCESDVEMYMRKISIYMLEQFGQ